MSKYIFVHVGSKTVLECFKHFFTRWRQTCEVTKIQIGGHRHLVFQKTFAMHSLFDQWSPNLVDIWRLRFGTHLWRRKCMLTEIQNGGCHHLIGFRRGLIIISWLFNRLPPNLVWRLKLCSVRFLHQKWCGKMQYGGIRHLEFLKIASISKISMKWCGFVRTVL